MRNLLAITLLTVVSFQAKAALVTVEWSGVVTSSAVAGTVDIGDTITGSYSYDDSAYPSSSGPISTTYFTGHVSSFSVNGYSGSTTGNRVAIFNDYTNGDQFDTRSSTSTAYTGDRFQGQSVKQIFVRFNDSTGTALSDLSLRSDLNSADFDFLEESRLDLQSSGSVNFLITDFTMTAVPVPAAVWLFGSALAGLGWMRRK